MVNYHPPTLRKSKVITTYHAPDIVTSKAPNITLSRRINMSLNPERKQVLAVVGVGAGIGEAVARKFAAENFVVALIARTQQKLQRIQGVINTDHPNSTKYYITDASNEDNVTSTFTAIKAELGPVNVLVYNAGLRRMTPRTILETSSEEFENFTKINMFGAFWASKAVLPDTLEAGKGTILCTGATGSLRGSSAVPG